MQLCAKKETQLKWTNSDEKLRKCYKKSRCCTTVVHSTGKNCKQSARKMSNIKSRNLSRLCLPFQCSTCKPCHLSMSSSIVGVAFSKNNGLGKKIWLLTNYYIFHWKQKKLWLLKLAKWSRFCTSRISFLLRQIKIENVSRPRQLFCYSSKKIAKRTWTEHDRKFYCWLSLMYDFVIWSAFKITQPKIRLLFNIRFAYAK